jgi:hypothetical protein
MSAITHPGSEAGHAAVGRAKRTSTRAGTFRPAVRGTRLDSAVATRRTTRSPKPTSKGQPAIWTRRPTGRSLAVGSMPWLIHALDQGSRGLSLVGLVVIGLVVVSACVTKVIQVIYAQRAKIIAANGKREVEALQKRSEADIAELRAVVHSVLLLSGKEEMIRAEVFNPDLPDGRRLSDEHILRVLSQGEPEEKRSADKPPSSGDGLTSVVRSIAQDGVA